MVNQFDTSGSSTRQFQESFLKKSNEFDLALLILVLGKNLLWIILFFVLGITGSFLYLRYTPPQYESATVLQIATSNPANQVLGVEDFYQQDLAHEIELLRSNTFTERALKRLNLEVSYYTKGQFLNTEVYNTAPFRLEVSNVSPVIYGVPVYITFHENYEVWVSYMLGEKSEYMSFKKEDPVILPHFHIRVFVNDSIYPQIIQDAKLLNENSYFFTINPPDIHSQFTERVRVDILNPTAQTIRVSYHDYNSLKAMDIVNAIGEEFITYDVEKKAESANRILSFIDDQLEIVYTRLRNTESALQSYKVENKISEDEKVSGVFINRLDKLQEDLTSLELDESILNEVEKSITGSKEIDVYKLLPILAGAKYENSIANMVNNMQDMLNKKQSAFYNVTPNSEEVKALNYQIDIQKKLILESIKSFKEKLSLRKKNLTAKINEIEGKFYKIPAEEMEYARLQRLFTINEKFYTLLLEKKAEHSISKAGFVSQNTVLVMGKRSSVPVSPERDVVYATGFLAGLILSFLLIAVRYFLHNDITSVYDISRTTQAPVLGIVPKYHKEIPVTQLLVDKNPKSLLAEAFRSIRTNLQFINSDPAGKVIALTSTISGEGKTFVAINISGIIAFTGKKVILLDLDMRKPKIHLGFGVENNNGVSTILSGKDQVSACINKSFYPNLDFITAGPIPPNPSELIISAQMDQLINYLKNEYDTIIIDTPPVGIVTDGVTLIQRADYPIYIFRANYSKKYFTENVNRLMTDSHIGKLSVVLNGVDLTKLRYGYSKYHYYQGYGYGYSYGYGYYSDEKSENHSGILGRIRRKINV
ncbi:MAG: polysaccharide biosynthesis tyrosine autokinase [Bacteroidetes bacterium]|nr:polysaccharide biosynthesis tyrosine autokinase [Bacteroidota bacterium]